MSTTLTQCVKIRSTLGSYLAKGLRKYYSRDGNRLVFSNGMSLNQLALEMWERLGYRGADSSTISRVIGGDRLFTKTQLYCFCSVLNIRSLQKAKLEDLLIESLVKRMGLNPNMGKLELQSDFVKILKSSLLEIRKYKDTGQVLLAEDWIDSTSGVLEERIRDTFNIELRSRLQEIYAQFLLEANEVALLSRPVETCFQYVVNNSKRIVKVANELRRPEYLCMARMNIADSYYINHAYEGAVINFRKSLTLLDQFSKSSCLVSEWNPLRQFAISLAYLGKGTEYLRIKKLLFRKIDHKDHKNTFTTYEGLIRAEAALGNSKKVKTFIVKSATALGEIKKSSEQAGEIFEIFLIRSELEAGKLLKVKSPNYFDKVGKKAIKQAEKYSYLRHKKVITRLMGGLLN